MPKKIVGILTEFLVDNFDEACIGIDKEGRIHFINRVACRLFGVNGSRVLGERIWDAFEMSDFTRSFVAIVKDTDARYRDEIVVMPDQRVLHTQLYPARGTEGRLAGAVAVIRDVTAINRIERDVSQLMRGISEELKVPLTSIKGYVETLLEGAYTEPEVLRRFLQIINEETNRMARVLVGLMDFGEGRPAAEAPTAPLEMGPLLRAVVASLQPLADQKQLQLTVDVSDHLPLVQANEAMLKQAITNLVDNAIKICGLNAQLPEKAGVQGRVRVSARDRNGLVVEVQDNGVGIPSEDLERIFERFYRVQTGPVSLLGGTGLGLSIAREIVDACGGTIEVRSVVGQGSTFVVRLPRAKT